MKTDKRKAPRKRQKTAGRKTRTGKKSKKLMPDSRAVISYCIVGILLALTIILYTEYHKRHKETSGMTCDYCRQATASITPDNSLDDPMSLHLLHAKANRMGDGNATRLKDSRYYSLNLLGDCMTPHVIPEMKSLLNLLGNTFQNELTASGLPKYKFEITAAALAQKTNGSMELYTYGTTVNIAAGTYLYRGRRITDPKADIAMANALGKLRNECRCIVSKDSKSNDYVITTVRIRP